MHHCFFFFFFWGGGGIVEIMYIDFFTSLLLCNENPCSWHESNQNSCKKNDNKGETYKSRAKRR